MQGDQIHLIESQRPFVAVLSAADNVTDLHPHQAAPAELAVDRQIETAMDAIIDHDARCEHLTTSGHHAAHLLVGQRRRADRGAL